MDNLRRAERSLAYVARSHTHTRPIPRVDRSTSRAAAATPVIVQPTSPPPIVDPVSVMHPKTELVATSVVTAPAPVVKTLNSTSPVVVQASQVQHLPRQHRVPSVQYRSAAKKTAQPILVSRNTSRSLEGVMPFGGPRSVLERLADPKPTHYEEVLQDESIAERAFKIGRSHSRGKHRSQADFRQKLVYGMALCVFVFGMGVAAQGLLTNRQATEQVAVLSAQSSETPTATSTVPSEEKPKGDYLNSYAVGPALPRLLSIPSLGVKARVLQVGVDENNQMGAPKNIYDSAWYMASAKPGEPGAVVIDGHYSGPTSHGVFSKLAQLQPGEVIEIERGDGEVIRYAVVKNETKQLDEVEMARLLVPVDASKPGLNLITCGGTYDVKNNTFPARTVVYASQL